MRRSLDTELDESSKLVEAMQKTVWERNHLEPKINR